MDVETALQLMVEKNPRSKPNKGFLSQLKSYAEEVKASKPNS